MDTSIKKLIDSLKASAKAQQEKDALCYADGGNEVDYPLDHYMETEAANVLQAIFDPENQPSQYGTTLV